MQSLAESYAGEGDPSSSAAVWLALLPFVWIKSSLDTRVLPRMPGTVMKQGLQLCHVIPSRKMVHDSAGLRRMAQIGVVWRVICLICCRQLYPSGCCYCSWLCHTSCRVRHMWHYVTMSLCDLIAFVSFGHGKLPQYAAHQNAGSSQWSQCIPKKWWNDRRTAKKAGSQKCQPLWKEYEPTTLDRLILCVII